MARGQRDQLDAPDQEERVRGDEEGVGPLAHERCEGRIDLLTGAGVADLDLYPEGASDRFHSCERMTGLCYVGRIDEHGDPDGCRHQLTSSQPPRQ